MTTGNISIARVQRIVSTQLEDFRRAYDEDPITENQDLRALSTAWLAVFMNEAFSPALVDSLRELVERLRQREDFRYRGWHALAPLDVALFALTEDRHWLLYVTTNLDHHKSYLRRFVTNAFALVANRLTFDGDMLDRTSHNLKAVHFSCDDLVVLFATSVLGAEEKKKQISEWASKFKLNADEAECLRALAAGQYVQNPFLRHFLWVQQYVSLCFAGNVPGHDEQGSDTVQLRLDGAAEVTAHQCELAGLCLEPDVIWKRMRSHPLMDSHVKIE